MLRPYTPLMRSYQVRRPTAPIDRRRRSMDRLTIGATFQGGDDTNHLIGWNGDGPKAE